MKKELLIIGAGNVGGYLSHNVQEFGAYEIIGFLDDDPAKQNKIIYGRKVIGAIDDIQQFKDRKDLNVVIGISSPKVKMTIHEKIAGYGFMLPNFVAKNVWLSKNVSLGQGVILYPGVSVNYETQIQDFVIMNMNCAIGHNCTIEAYSTLAPGVNLGGFTYLERCVSVGIGASSKQNVRIGKGAVIGGQSMLVKDVVPEAVVTGVPGKEIKK